GGALRSEAGGGDRHRDRATARLRAHRLPVRVGRILYPERGHADAQQRRGLPAPGAGHPAGRAVEDAELSRRQAPRTRVASSRSAAAIAPASAWHSALAEPSDSSTAARAPGPSASLTKSMAIASSSSAWCG